MRKMKWYGVHKGRVPGVYATWAECKEQTDRYSNAVFKAFRWHEDARTYAETGKTQRLKECFLDKWLAAS